VIAAGVAVALVALFTASPAVRARGDDFLHLFRTAQRSNLAIIDVPLPQLPGADPAALDDVIDVDIPTGRGVRDPGRAQDSVDFNVRSLHREQIPRVTVFVGDTAVIHVNRPVLERALRSGAGFGVQLPRELDTPINAQLSAAVRQVWSDPSGDITLWEMRSPRLYTTEGPSWEELRDRLIQISSVVAPERARALQSVEDWDNTVIVPVPPGATSRRVRADGTDDVLVIERGDRTTLVWQRYGALHILDAHLPYRTVVQLANSLR
jgi:hypothetical protein